MNQELKKLLTPKLLEWGADSDDNFSEELQKFAELIVRECSKVIDEETVGELDDYAMRRIEHCSWMIKQHFGVK